MTEPRPPEPGPERVLCLGEALVDIVAEDPGRPLPAARRLVPHPGGVVANVAVYAARAGARVALAGAAGADVWGRWLRERLALEGVDVSLFTLLEGRRTPLALVSLDADGRPAYELRADPGSMVDRALESALEPAVAESAALFISSNTLSGPEERELTMRARQAALQAARPMVFDVNLRLHRWSSRADAISAALACLPGTLLVRANREEAALMTGEGEPERAARGLLGHGARLVVLTLGPRGAILRGELEADCAPVVPARLRSTAGAGDALTGTLLAHLAGGGCQPAAVGVALPEAIRAAARACELWGSID